jgi:hypothetical protein
MLSEKAGGDMHPPRLQDLNITQLPAALVMDSPAAPPSSCRT